MNSAIEWVVGLLALVVVAALYIAFYALLVAVILWVALSILQHFGVLPLLLTVIA